MKINNKEYKITSVRQKSRSTVSEEMGQYCKTITQPWKDGGLSGADCRHHRGCHVKFDKKALIVMLCR